MQRALLRTRGKGCEGSMVTGVRERIDLIDVELEGVGS